MKRRYLSAAEKSRLLDRQKGICACGCKEPLVIGQIEWDHRLALQFGGTNALDNFDALIRGHHRKKSNDENTARAKCDRMKAKHEGTHLNARDRELASLRSRTKQLNP